MNPSHPSALVVFTALVCLPVVAETLQGAVVHVVDGDTITLLDGANARHQVRLQGIDAPEKGQAFGLRSKENLSRLVYGNHVRADCHKLDRNSRHICTVWVQPPDCSYCGLTLDAGHAQLREGLAWHVKRYAGDQTSEEQARYADAEVNARGRKGGLWEAEAPMPPWDWRAAKLK